MSLLERIVPAARWIRRYQLSFLPRDLGGGLAVAAMLIPQGLAFAQLVQIPPVMGLWTGVAAMLGYALFGPSRQLMVGPEAGTAIIVVAVLAGAGIEAPEQRLGAASLLAVMVAVLFVLAGVFRLGAIADFLSRPILVGYINGVALSLIASQLPGALRLPSSESDFLPQVREIAATIDQTHWPTLWLSAAALVLVVALRRMLPAIPGAVLVVVGGIAASMWLDLEARGLRVIGRIEQGLPSVGLPPFELSAMAQLGTGAASVALLVYASSVLTSRVFADKQREEVSANREFFGLAAANLCAGLVQGLPSAGSDARTLVNHAAGARTQAAGVFASAATVAIILVFAPLMALLPTATLSAVVIASALSLFELRGLVRIWRVRRSEGLLALVTLGGVLVLGLLPGVLVAVALSVVDLVRRAAHPHDAVLGRQQGRRGYHDIELRPGSEILPGLIIYRLDAPLFFANARFLREQVRRLVETAKAPVRMVVLDCGAMFDLDVTAATMLQELDADLHARGIRLGLAEPHAPMRRVLRRTGLLQKIGPEDVFATVGEAIRAYVERTEADLGADLDWVRADGPSGPGNQGSS